MSISSKSEQTSETEVDQYYIDGIKNGQQKVLNQIYERFFSRTQHFVENNSGSKDDGRDIFQDALLLIFKKLNDPSQSFNLTSSFGTYLLSVCKYLWMNQLRRSGRNTSSIELHENLESDLNIEETLQERDRTALFQEKLKELGEDCQRLLKLFFQKTPMLKIAEMMGYKSVQYAKKRKFKCKEQLIKRIKGDARYAELMDA